MRDKLTQKRVKVDYQLIIKVAGLEEKFSRYLWSKKKSISIRRLALAFLRSERVDVERIYYGMKDRGITSYQQLVDEEIRIANFNCWED